MGKKKETGNDSTLVETTFNTLFKEERLPSGHSFKLMPDTVETALKVAEADGTHTWKKKALQAYTVVSVVGEFELHDEESPQSPDFINHMLDADVVFLVLAWSAQLSSTKMELSEPAPCPTCAQLFTHIDFGELKVLARPDTVGGPKAIWEVEGISDADLPKSVKGSRIYVQDPTWLKAKKGLSDRSWGNQDVVAIHRAVACLRVAKGGGPPRSLVKAEWSQMKARTLNSVIEVMEKHIPHFEERLELKCANCEQVSIIPFNEGLG